MSQSRASRKAAKKQMESSREKVCEGAAKGPAQDAEDGAEEHEISVAPNLCATHGQESDGIAPRIEIPAHRIREYDAYAGPEPLRGAGFGVSPQG